MFAKLFTAGYALRLHTASDIPPPTPGQWSRLISPPVSIATPSCLKVRYIAGAVNLTISSFTCSGNVTKMAEIRWQDEEGTWQTVAVSLTPKSDHHQGIVIHAVFEDGGIGDSAIGGVTLEESACDKWGTLYSWQRSLLFNQTLI